MIRVGLVDDQTLVRQGIRSLLELSDEIDRAIQEADAMEDPQPADVYEGVFA